MKPEEKNHILTITGNLFGEDPNITIFTNTIGSYNVQIIQKVSSLTQVEALLPQIKQIKSLIVAQL